MTTLLNARLPRRVGYYCLEIQQGHLRSIMPMADLRGNAVSALDIQGDWISLGGVDLQINGALGLAFPDLDEASMPMLAKICQFLWNQGIDSFLPTIVTTSQEKVHQSLATLKAFRTTDPPQTQAQILGCHLEGPFLAPPKRGAHPAEFLQPLTLPRVQELLGQWSDQVKVITLAPELDPSGETIPWLRAQQIIVSLGHSLATAPQGQTAFSQGATMVTHAFNAMPGLHHRDPGLLGAALLNPTVACGLIADGHHVIPEMIELLLRACRGRLDQPRPHCEGIFLVSDALAPLGLPDGKYPWDSREIEVNQGTARLPDGTLSGTTLPLLEGVKNLAQWGICEIGDAIALATEAPRNAIGLPGFSIGQPANFLRWHWHEQTQQLNWERLILET